MGMKPTICFMLACKYYKDYFLLYSYVPYYIHDSVIGFPIILSQCPESSKTLRRIGKTRYFIIQNTEQRGDFVTIEQARQDCNKHGLKLATVKNLLSLAIVGRPLERMAFKERMKDTWCKFFNIYLFT